MNWIMKNSLYLVTLLNIFILIYMIIFWDNMSIAQRYIGIFNIGLVIHLWEEGKFPGGFTKMITEKLNFTQSNPNFGSFITVLLVILVSFVPFFLSNISFLVFACITLGYIEAIAHIIAIKMFDKKVPYTPGMISAVFILLPISIITTYHLISTDSMYPMAWAFSIIYLIVSVALAQRIVIQSSGMKYSEFLSNVKQTLLKR